MKATEIRQTFLEFFKSKAHTIVPSAPMVVKNDPTLMFTNAGMNQFKDIFLGNEPAFTKRAADSQKCLRVSGKHNDLEEVGHDTYHHTMFEMLGNWSFGDYFKKEAIDWAWELLVDVFHLPTDRLYATIFEGSDSDGVPMDNEAYECWLKYLPKDHILTGNKHDNFWEMGETGPCGPCSEIHFDLRDESEREKVPGASLVNQSDPLVIEIWNLVFMQFNRKADGHLELLPAKHVDTGMGFERLCMVIQNKKSNYDTDVFTPLIDKISELSGFAYREDHMRDVAMRVIADHVRAISFSIADGQMPSNVKAGYVIRRILRRAVRYAYTYLNVRDPFLVKLVPTLVEQMGSQYKELVAGQGLIEKVISEEETSFLRTLATGINLLDGIMSKCSSGTISGSDAFLLYDTYGFPIDLTELIAGEKSIKVDLDGFAEELKKQKERSRGAATVEAGDWVILKDIDHSEFVGYDEYKIEASISRWREVKNKNKVSYQIVLDKTPFYGNMGGQVGDTGKLTSNDEVLCVIDTIKENNLTIHIVDHLPEDFSATFEAEVDLKRRDRSAANHTATHLMHEALRQILGTHVEQKGSLVTPEYLRFDFSHFEKVTDEQLRQVEMIVNEKIRADYHLEEFRNCTIDEAKAKGAMMLFGEKYGDKVRMIKFGSSIELCGGIHSTSTGRIGMFRILSEGSSSAGVRRIEAITGYDAEQHMYQSDSLLSEINSLIGSKNTLDGVKKLQQNIAELQQKLDAVRLSRDEYLLKDLTASAVKTTGGVTIASGKFDIAPESLKDISFKIKAGITDVAIIIGSVYGGKPMLSVALSDSLIAKGLSAGNIVREAAKEMQGGGGGQAAYATAGGKNPEGIDSAISKAIQIVKQAL